MYKLLINTWSLRRVLDQWFLKNITADLLLFIEKVSLHGNDKLANK